MGNIGFLLGKGNQITGKHLPGKKEPLPCTANKIRYMYFQKRNCATSFSNFHIHSCICEQFIYSHDRSTYFDAESWEYINCSQIHECRNWEWGLAVSFHGIFVSNFRYSVFAVLPAFVVMIFYMGESVFLLVSDSIYLQGTISRLNSELIWIYQCTYRTK